jgi:NADH dehydrogenase [ubiquinone] 1 alpha subcomplex assembly factor 5
MSISSFQRRSNSSSSASTSTSNAFDRSQKLLQRDNAARAVQRWRRKATEKGSDASVPLDDSADVVEYDYIRDEIAARLVDRLDDMKRSFPLALDLGSGCGHLYRAICADDGFEVYNDEGPTGGIGGVRKLVQVDSSLRQLFRDEDIVDETHNRRCATYRMHVKDEEDALPFPDGTFDLVMTSCALHWVNQLPNVLSEVHRVLKPDGCLLLAVLGGTDTLPELRAAMVLAELEREGGVSPHVGPFVQPSDIGSLLQRAGFALPTIDVDTHTLSFPNTAVLMEHLQRMGENNASLQKRDRVSLDTFLATSCIYDHLFPATGYDHNDNGNATSQTSEIEASIQIIYAIGWTPHESQPAPLERGSATHKVGDLAAVEVTMSSSSTDADSAPKQGNEPDTSHTSH